MPYFFISILIPFQLVILLFFKMCIRDRLDSCESAIVDRKFLHDNVRFDGASQVVGLPCEVGCRMIVHTVFLKVIIAGEQFLEILTKLRSVIPHVGRKLCPKQDSLFIPILLIIEMMAVSYTHLDVYKRQPITRGGSILNG